MPIVFVPRHQQGQRHRLVLLHTRKAGGTAVSEEFRRAGCRADAQEWGPFRFNHTHPTDRGRWNILVARDPVRRAISAYLFEGGAPQCWFRKPDAKTFNSNGSSIGIGLQLVSKCFPRYANLVPFDEYMNASLRVWSRRGARLTSASESEGVVLGPGRVIGRPFVPDYLVRKLADGRADVRLAKARFDAQIDAVVLNGMFCNLRQNRSLPPCFKKVNWNTPYSAEGYIHRSTPFDSALGIVKRELSRSLLARHRSTVEAHTQLDNALFRHLTRRCLPAITTRPPPIVSLQPRQRPAMQSSHHGIG